MDSAASGDAGGSLGAALAYHYYYKKNKRNKLAKNTMKGSYLGPKFNTNETKTILDNLSSNYELLDEKEILDKTSEELINGKVIGWFQGKTEFGPRALGNRSILWTLGTWRCKNYLI